MNWFHHKHKATGMVIRQIENFHKYYNQEGELIMSTKAGSSSVFQEVPTPAGSVFPAGTSITWTVDDTADISLAPAADGTGVTATCVATPTGTSYNLTCTSDYAPPGAPTPVSATLNVAIIVTPPAPTGMTINQIS